MSVDSSLDESPKKFTLDDTGSATEKEVAKFEQYIANAEPDHKFEMDALSLKLLLNLIREKDKQEVVIVPRILHEDTKTVVINATNDLLAKLAEAQVKHNLHNGWRHPPKGSKDDGRYFTTEAGCVDALFHHLAKGDVLDSIAYLTYLNELSGGHKVKLIADKF